MCNKTEIRSRKKGHTNVRIKHREKWCACGSSHDSLVVDVSATLADDLTRARWHFAPPAPLESSAYVQPEKWTASVPAGYSRRRCRFHSSGGTCNSIVQTVEF